MYTKINRHYEFILERRGNLENQVLLLEELRKSIKGKEIIKGISFTINEGEILGFLGPNGAGKSTTLRMIVGLSKPTSGKIEICGFSLSSNYVKAMSQVGSIIEGPDLYNYMSGMDNLKMFADMGLGISKKIFLTLWNLWACEIE